jgi:hypothetical protein
LEWQALQKSALKIQTPGKHLKEWMQQKETPIPVE